MDIARLSQQELRGINNCNCEHKMLAIYYCPRSPPCNGGQTFMCQRCLKKHDHAPLVIMDECNEMLEDYGKIAEKGIALNATVDNCYQQYKEIIDICQDIKSRAAGGLTAKGIISEDMRDLVRDAAAIRTISSQLKQLMRQAEMDTANNKLLDLKDLKNDFDDLNNRLSQLEFMASLGEGVIWDNYKGVFCTEEADNITEQHELSINPLTTQLFFKFKMRAQTERIRNLEEEVSIMKRLLGVVVSKM